jgi:hypothetical protein
MISLIGLMTRGDSLAAEAGLTSLMFFYLGDFALSFVELFLLEISRFSLPVDEPLLVFKFLFHPAGVYAGSCPILR